MSKLDTLAKGSTEAAAITDDDWATWLAAPQTRRLAGFLQEEIAQTQAWIDQSRARAATLIGEREDEVESHNRNCRDLRGRAAALAYVLKAMENTGKKTDTASAPESEAA